MDSECTQTASEGSDFEVEARLPQPLTSLYADINKKLDPDALHELATKTFTTTKLSGESVRFFDNKRGSKQ